MFAQISKGTNQEAMYALLAFGGALLLIFILIHLLFLLNLSRCLKAIAPNKRDMEPGRIWLLFVPVFNSVWMFIVVARVASSLKKEYEYRRLKSRGDDFGRSVGFACGVFTISSFIPTLRFVPIIGSLLGYFMYWHRISGYRSVLKKNHGNIFPQPSPGRGEQPASERLA